MDSWIAIKQHLIENGHLSSMRADGLAVASEPQSIVEILRKEHIDEDGIGNALKAVADFRFFDRSLFSDDDFKAAVRGYKAGCAWISIGNAFFSTNPYSSRVYNFAHENYSRAAEKGIGFISYDYTEKSVEFQKVHCLDDGSNVDDVRISEEALIDKFLSIALDKGASDIHISKDSIDRVELSLRVDSAKKPFRSFNKVDYESFSNLLWERCQSGPRNPLTPQDGRLKKEFQGRTVWFRANRMPEETPDGKIDKWALRVLKPDTKLRSLTDFKLEKYELDLLDEALTQSAGIVISTGPTSHGKTTLLHAGIRRSREVDPTLNYMAVEKPVEVQLDGVHQFSIDGVNLTFENALPALLRQDPDVIFVGEINEPAVAKMAMQAAETGHLMISTLHAVTAHGVFNRLHELGVARATAIDRMVLYTSQRLLRKLCERCKTECTIDDYPDYKIAKYEQLLTDISGGDRRVFRRNHEGCSHCHGGIKGRVLVIELLRRSPDLVDWLTAGNSISELRRNQISEGWKDLVHKAMVQVVAGVVDLDDMSQVPDITEDRPSVADRIRINR